MAHLTTFTPTKTYATRENAIKAVEKICGPNEAHFASTDLRYVLLQDDAGRWFPVFIGQAALTAGMHFHFCVTL